MSRIASFAGATAASVMLMNSSMAASPTQAALGLQSFATPTMVERNYLGQYADPIFRSRVYRVTGKPGTRAPGLSYSWSTDARHRYSKISAWNCNATLALITNSGARNDKVFLDAQTLKPRYERRSPGTEMRWLPDRKNAMFYTNGNAVGIWNVKTDKRTILHRFAGMNKVYIGPWEGNLSHNGKRVALMGDDGSRKWVIVYSLARERELMRRRLDSSITLDWLSISPNGRNIVMNGKFSSGNGDQTKVFDLQLKQLQFWKKYGTPSHYDLAIDERGVQVAIGVAKSGPYEGRVIKRALKTGQITPLTPRGYASHTSARNVNRKGWAYVTYQGRSSWAPFADEVIAVRTDGSQRFERIAQLRSRRTHYRAEAHAVPSPDGRFVMWASNWNRSNGMPITTLVAAVNGAVNTVPKARCLSR